jgi:hypothetical protein
MFSDTDCPVCLALFVPEDEKFSRGLEVDDFLIYEMQRKIGNYKQISSLLGAAGSFCIRTLAKK